MATNFLSAGVGFSEIDNSLTTPTAGLWSGAAVIQSGWGPVNDPQYITSENELVSVFGKPNQYNFKNWLTAASYLAYSGSMYVTRANSSKLSTASSAPIAQVTQGISHKISTKHFEVVATGSFYGYEKNSLELEQFVAAYVKVPRYAYIKSRKEILQDGSFIVVKVFRGIDIPSASDIEQGLAPEVTTYVTSEPISTIEEYEDLKQNYPVWIDAGRGIGSKVEGTFYKTYMITPGVSNVKNRGLYYKDWNGMQSDLITYYVDGEGGKYSTVLTSGLCNPESFIEYIRVKRTNEEGREAFEMYSGISGITETNTKIKNGTYYRVNDVPHFCKLTSNRFTLESPTNERTYSSYIDYDDEEYLLIDDEYGDIEADGKAFPKLTRTQYKVLHRNYGLGELITTAYGSANVGNNNVFFGVLSSTEIKEIDQNGQAVTWKEYRDDLVREAARIASGGVDTPDDLQVEAFARENHMVFGDKYYDCAPIARSYSFVWNEAEGDFRLSEDVVVYDKNSEMNDFSNISGDANVNVLYIDIEEKSSYQFITIQNVKRKIYTSENVINGIYTMYPEPEDGEDATHVAVDFYYARILDSNLMNIGGAGFALRSEDWVLKADGKTFIQYNSKSSDYFSVPVVSNSLNVVGATLTKNPIVIKPNYLTILNDQDYELNYEDGQGTYGEFCCRFPGKLGDSIMVTYADADNFRWWSAPVLDDFGNVVGIEDYTKYFAYAPSTSTYAQDRGASNDEIHLLVIDAGGRITGTKGAILEKYEHLSKAKNAKGIDGDSTYYVKVLKNRSKYIYCIDVPDGSNWGENVTDVDGEGVAFDAAHCNDDGYPKFHFLSGGNDDYNSTDGQIEEAFEFYRNREQYNVINIVCGAVSGVVARWVVENICEVKRDCIAFASVGGDNPVVSTSLTKTAQAETAWRDKYLNLSSSYLCIDSGFKQMYDKYNDEYRVIPLCGDIAGLWAQTNERQDYGYSAAGYNRGYVKNVVKLMYSPMKEHRDLLYPKSINPVITEPGTGTLLLGDRTSLMKPSAFRFLNVRYLFVYLERILTEAAKYSLFEINDSVSRANLIALVTPALDRCIGNRTINAYKVVCDSSNNTNEMIDNGEMQIDIRIQPNKSIQWVQLVFTADRTGTNYSEA